MTSRWAHLASLAALTLLAVACAPAEEEGASSRSQGSNAAPECPQGSLETVQSGTLTIATSEPAYEPWMVNNDPTNKKGYESAVAYAVADQLGYDDSDVTWVRVPFDAAIKPGAKQFDFDINQFSITEERKQAVDFSSSYYDVRQAVVAVKGNPAADATSLADLAKVRLGAQVGTTSLSAINESISPSQDPRVFNSNDDAKLALDNGQIDALVVDLPTAFFLSAVEIKGGVIVGQLPEVGGQPEQFGLVLDKGSALTDCVSGAVDTLRDDGTLKALQQQWLAEVAGARNLS